MRTTAIAAVALAAALALGGCSGQAGAAAVVDGEPIAATTVDRTTRELNQLFQVDARAVLTMLIVSPAYLAEARANGVAKSRDQALGYLTEVIAADPGSTVDVGSFSDATLDIVAFDMAVRELSQLPEAPEIGVRVNEQIAALDVDVNPRFGQFSAEASSILPATPEWIVSAPTS